MINKISVIMAVYNCDKTICESIDSILLQTYHNWELILCDDGSTDNTYKIISEYQIKYPQKIKVLKNEMNLGLPATLNICLQNSCGEFIARMDGDDISLPSRFEKQVRFLDENPNFSVVGTSMIRFNELDGDYGIEDVTEYPDSGVLRSRVPFCHATIMMRKTVYDKLEGYTVSARTRRGQDVDLWFRFYELGFVGANLKESLYKMRQDINTIKRRSFKSGLNNSITLWIGFRKLKFPLKDYIYILRPIISSIIPKGIMYEYHKRRKSKTEN